MTSKIPTKLFIGNLPDFCRREDLLAKFEKFGNVVEFDIVSNYGFAHFETPDEAKAAADALNGTTMNGSTLRVELSHSKVRQKPGMGEREGCYRCGKDGHWSKDCPRGPRRPPKRDSREDPYDEDPYYRDPYDPYYRSRYPPAPPPPPPPSYRRYDPYYEPYDRRPVTSRDPYLRERMGADPYAYYYERRSPPPPTVSSASAASARGPDQYAKAPYTKEQYAKDMYGKDPYSKDPYAARTAETRDRYDDYYDRKRAYPAESQSSAYPKHTGSSSGYGYPPTASGYSSAPSSGYSGGQSSGYSSQAPASSSYSSSAYTSGSKFSSSTVQSSRVPGPY